MALPRGYAAIGLYHPKNHYNTGAVLRAAHCYDAAMVVATGRRYQRASTDTTAAERHLPLLHADDLHTVIPYGCVPVAVELHANAQSLCDYTHPHSAFYIFGPEDSSLGDTVISWCRDIVQVPTRHCMNLAATVNVVLYDRLLKQQRRL